MDLPLSQHLRDTRVRYILFSSVIHDHARSYGQDFLRGAMST